MREADFPVRRLTVPTFDPAVIIVLLWAGRWVERVALVFPDLVCDPLEIGRCSGHDRHGNAFGNLVAVQPFDRRLHRIPTLPSRFDHELPFRLLLYRPIPAIDRGDRCQADTGRESVCDESLGDRPRFRLRSRRDVNHNELTLVRHPILHTVTP